MASKELPKPQKVEGTVVRSPAKAPLTAPTPRLGPSNQAMIQLFRMVRENDPPREPQPPVVQPLAPPRLQAKLTINQPDDEYEREADRMADLHLQHTLGNEEVLPLLHADRGGREISSGTARFGYDFSRIPVDAKALPRLQTKLTVNTPGDKYEQEADHLAERVTSMPEPELRLQPACSCGGSCPKCQIERAHTAHERLQTQRVRSSDVGQVAIPPVVHESLQSPGQPLDPGTRAFMEPRFGRDFSGVRIHADAKATESARALDARAYTAAHHVVFDTAHYSPGTYAGNKLLAHELTHVLQQESVGPCVMRQAKSGESTEPIRQGLPEPVLRYLDKPTFFGGNPSITATIRVNGIDVEFQDGGKLYIDRPITPLDTTLIRQKLEKVEASLKWYIRILGPSLATKGKVSALAESELADRLFIIKRLTEGKKLKDILSELTSLDIANFQFIAVSASVVALLAGSGITPASGAAAGRTGMGKLAVRESGRKALGEAEKEAVTEAEKKALAEAEKKAGTEAEKKALGEAEKKAVTEAEAAPKPPEGGLAATPRWIPGYGWTNPRWRQWIKNLRSQRPRDIDVPSENVGEEVIRDAFPTYKRARFEGPLGQLDKSKLRGTYDLHQAHGPDNPHDYPHFQIWREDGSIVRIQIKPK